MACLGEITVKQLAITSTITQNDVAVELTGIAAELPIDGTSIAYLQQTGDPISAVNTETGLTTGVILIKDNVYEVTAHNVVSSDVTREYCECNGLCYVEGDAPSA
jgi:hypothetical protein